MGDLIYLSSTVTYNFFFFDFSRFTEIFVCELESTADLKTLVVDYLQGLSPNAAIVDGIVRSAIF